VAQRALGWWQEHLAHPEEGEIRNPNIEIRTRKKD
jgi:hypothetical protein